MQIRFPNGGGEAELGSIEEAFWLRLFNGSLENAVPEFLLTSVAVEWKNCSRMYMGNREDSPWRTTDYNALFRDYVKAVFSAADPGELDREVKRRFFKPGVF